MNSIGCPVGQVKQVVGRCLGVPGAIYNPVPCQLVRLVMCATRVRRPGSLNSGCRGPEDSGVSSGRSTF